MKIKEFKYFYPEKPQLTLIDSDAFQGFSDHPDYICEPKFNEQRCQLHLINGVAHFWDRHGKQLSYDTNPNYAEGKAEITRIMVEKFGDKGYFLFDAGLRHNKVRGINNKLVIYDIHIYENELLNRLQFQERRDLLELHFMKREYADGWAYDIEDTVHLINQHPTDFLRHFKEYTCADDADYSWGNPEEFEGLVIKNLKGKLKLGRASASDSIWMFKVRIKTGRHRY